MNINEFQKFVIDHSVEDKDVFFSMNALMGEIGELANVLKKEEFQKIFPEYNNQVLQEQENGTRVSVRQQQVDEAGDVLFYLIQVLSKKNIDIETIIAYQVQKLQSQTAEYGRKFIK